MAFKDINLVINGDPRQASAGYDVEKQQYQVVLPGKDVSEKPYAAVQGSEAVYDKDGKLLRVGALGYSPEGGYYRMQWPTKQDSIYNANAAKEYAPQVFQQVKKKEDGGTAEYVPRATGGFKFREVSRPDTAANTYPIYDSNGKIINRQQGSIPSVDMTNYQNPYDNYQGEGKYGVVQDQASGKYYQVPLNYNPQNITHIDERADVAGTPAWNRAHGYTQTGKNGMKMNYSQYLQAGGTAEDQTQQIVAQVVAALKQDPETTMKKLQEMGEQGKQLFELALQADPELQEMFSQSMKCGGKVRAKVKKAKCGKKLENGDKIQKASTGCTCQLKRVGGKLIEVDSCTGLPIHKSGGIMKFAPGGSFKIQNGQSLSDVGLDSNYFMDRSGRNTLYYRDPNTGKIYRAKNTFGNMFSNYDEFEFDKDAEGYDIESDDLDISDEAKNYFQGITDNGGKVANTFISKNGTNARYTANADGTVTRDVNYGAGKIAWNADQFTQGKHAGTGVVKESELPDDVRTWYQQYRKQQAGAGAGAGAGRTKGQTAGQINAAKVGMANADGTGWDVAKRKEWMNSDEGKAYLASLNNGQGLGFSTSNYTGTAAQNRALFGAYKNFANWKKQRDAAASTATPNVFGNDMTNRQLLEYDPEKEGAQALSTEAAARRQKLIENQKAQDAYTQSLTRNGITYDDPYAYEEAVDEENTQRSRAYRGNILLNARSANDAATARRFRKTYNAMEQDKELQKLMQGAYYVGGKRVVNPEALKYIKDHYSGADYIRARRLARAAATVDRPARIAGWIGPEKPQAFDPDATTFKKGGIISYKDYLDY